MSYVHLSLTVLIFFSYINAHAAHRLDPKELTSVRALLVFGDNQTTWTQRIEEGFSQKILEGNYKPKVTSLYLKGIKPQHTKIDQLIKNNRISYLVLCDDQATQLALQELSKFKLPIIITGISGTLPKLEQTAVNRAQISFVYSQIAVEQSLKLLKDITNNRVRIISVLADRSSSSTNQIEQLERYFSARSDRISLRKVYQVDKWKDWKKAVKEINETDDAIWILESWSIFDGRDKRLKMPNIQQWTRQSLKIPSLSTLDLHTQTSAMAGICIKPQWFGSGAAHQILRAIKEKIEVRHLPPYQITRGEIMLNLELTDRIGIVVPIEILEYASVIKKRIKDEE